MSFTPDTLQRQWEMLRAVPRAPRRITVGELARILEGSGHAISKRTIQRDLNALSAVFPLVADQRDRTFGWSWDKNAPTFDLPGLSQGEALTLLMANAYLKSVLPQTMSDQLRPLFQLAKEKVRSEQGRQADRWLKHIRVIPATQPLLMPETRPEVEQAIHTALLHEVQCRICYESRQGVRDYLVNPLALVMRGPLTYLIATIKTYPDRRILAMHRIRSVDLTDHKALRPQDFDLDAYLESGAFGWGQQPGEIALKLRFKKEAGQHLRETRLATNQKVIELPDGRLEVSAKIPETAQLIWWLLGFGDQVEILEPCDLRERIAKTLKQALAQYA